MYKLRAVKCALKGLDVEYHRHNKQRNITHALVGGYSIIWHQYSYTRTDEPTVEVMLPDGEIKAHFPIRELRKLVQKTE